MDKISSFIFSSAEHMSYSGLHIDDPERGGVGSEHLNASEAPKSPLAEILIDLRPNLFRNSLGVSDLQSVVDYCKSIRIKECRRSAG